MKRALKSIAASAGLVCVSPLLVVDVLVRRLSPRRAEQVFQGSTQLLALLPGLPGNFMRAAFLRRTLSGFGTNASVGFCSTFATREVSIGEQVYVGAFCHLGHAVIGRDTMLGNNVTLLSGKHAHGSDRTDVPMQFQETGHQTLQIGEDVWIGNGAIVMADVGAHSIVGAGSVVVKPVAAYSVVAGNPARLIRQRERPSD